jgi:NADH-quinone oxidoreductase subunit M
MLNNFIGEFLVLQGTAEANFRFAVFAALGVILAAWYLLWLYQRVFLGDPAEAVASHFTDLTAREFAALVPLLVMMLWMGVYSQSFLPRISAATTRALGPLELRVEAAIPPTARLEGHAR